MQRFSIEAPPLSFPGPRKSEDPKLADCGLPASFRGGGGGIPPEGRMEPSARGRREPLSGDLERFEYAPCSNR